MLVDVVGYLFCCYTFSMAFFVWFLPEEYKSEGNKIEKVLDYYMWNGIFEF